MDASLGELCQGNYVHVWLYVYNTVWVHEPLGLLAHNNYYYVCYTYVAPHCKFAMNAYVPFENIYHPCFSVLTKQHFMQL